MAQKFKVKPTVGSNVISYTYRVGTKTAPLTDADRGKLVTLGTEGSQAVLGQAGNQILGVLTSVETHRATQDGYVIGGVQLVDYAIVDTTGCAIGDFVVIKEQPAVGTKGLTKVQKSQTYTGWQVHDTNVIMKV